MRQPTSRQLAGLRAIGEWRELVGEKRCDCGAAYFGEACPVCAISQEPAR